MEDDDDDGIINEYIQPPEDTTMDPVSEQELGEDGCPLPMITYDPYMDGGHKPGSLDEKLYAMMERKEKERNERLSGGSAAAAEAATKKAKPTETVEKTPQAKQREATIRLMPYVEDQVSGTNIEEELKSLPPVAREMYNAHVETQLAEDAAAVAAASSANKAYPKKRKSVTISTAPSDEYRGRPYYSSEVRKKAAARKEKNVSQLADFSLLASDAKRDFSPIRRLVTNDNTKTPDSLPVGDDPTDTEHCTMTEWVLCNGGQAAIDTKKVALETEIQAWLNDKENKEWRATLAGNWDGGFPEGHPCATLNLSDATQCRSFTELEGLDSADYISSIESAFGRSIDLCHELSGRVHSQTASEWFIAQIRHVNPTMKDSTLYTFLRHHHGGHWRAETGLVDAGVANTSFPPTSSPGQHFVHCTVRDISQVLRNPRLVERMTEPCSTERGVLVGFSALCGGALRRLPHDSSVWDKDSLDFDRESWRRCPRWASYFAALVARLSWLPLPNLDKLGPAGRWWLGHETPLEGPLMRQIRIHLARITIVRCLYTRLVDQKRGLSLKSVSTMFRTERGCTTALQEVHTTVYNWLWMRYVSLDHIHNLTAAWLSYIFSPVCVDLDYQPLSITFRVPQTDGQASLLRSVQAKKMDRTDNGHGISMERSLEFERRCSEGLGILFTERNRARRADGDVRASEELAAEYCRKPWGELSQRMLIEIFQQAVWSNYRGTHSSTLCIDNGATSLAVALATYCRSYERNGTARRVSKRNIPSLVYAMPWRAVARGPSYERHTRPIVETSQLCWPGLATFEGLFGDYAQSCRKISIKTTLRTLPWKLCRPPKPPKPPKEERKRLKEERKRLKEAGKKPKTAIKLSKTERKALKEARKTTGMVRESKWTIIIRDALAEFNRRYRVVLGGSSGDTNALDCLRAILADNQCDQLSSKEKEHIMSRLYEIFGMLELKKLKVVQRS